MCLTARPQLFAALAVLGVLLSVPPALAGDVPNRCEAVFVGPAKACDLFGTWTAGGAGRSAEQATRNAQERLSALVNAALDERAARGESALQREGCGAALATQVRVVCYPEPDLALDRLCFAQLREPACYRGPSIDLKGVGWKVIEKGRDQICLDVETRLAAQSATDAERLACRVRCLQDAEVRCAPPNP
jgi:hypothetical protein